MRSIIRFACAGALPVVLAAAVAAPPSRGFEDPIHGTAHGAAFGADGRPIEATAGFIARTQEAYVAHVLAGASADQQARYEGKRAYLADLARDTTRAAERPAALYARSLLLDWLIDTVAPADAKRLKARNGVLIAWLLRGVEGPDAQAWSPQNYQQAQLAQAGLLPPVPAVGLTPEILQAREAYAKQCRKAGVPIPPTWGKTGAGFWNSKGILGDPFISRKLTAELFEYQSADPKGVCLALPRYGAGAAAPASLLGIICQGTGIATGGGATVASACFWDNQLDQRGVPIARTGEFPINTSFAAGDELDGGSGGTCTACHAGENAYIVHPKDGPFMAIANLKPDAWYRPIVAAGWPLNPGPNTQLAGVKLGATDSSCLDCHSAARKQRLPEIVKEIAKPPGENYCDAVLKTSFLKTMPPDGPFPDPDYQKHMDFLTKACADAAR